jgi:hypothetical protein
VSRVAKLYPFEGRMLTVAEIHRIVSCVSASTIRIYVQMGMTTRAEMTSRDLNKLRSVAGAKGAASLTKLRGRNLV